MKYENFNIGYSGSFTTTITAEKNKQFGDLVGDHNPVHFDEERMKNSIFGKIVTNGFLTESTIGSALVKTFVSDESVVVELKKRMQYNPALKKEIKLIAPVFIGDTITAHVVVKERFPEKQRLLCSCSVVKRDKTRVVEAEFLVKILEI